MTYKIETDLIIIYLKILLRPFLKDWHKSKLYFSVLKCNTVHGIQNNVVLVGWPSKAIPLNY